MVHPVNLRSATVALAQTVLDTLLPVPCPVCSREREVRRALLCHQCQELVAPQCHELPCGLLVYSLFDYGGPIAEAITALKYRNEPWRGRMFGQMIGRALLTGRAHDSTTTLVPVPVSRVRGLERGYNQAAIISRHAGRSSGMVSDTRRLKRLDSLASQTLAGRDERLARVLEFESRPWSGTTILIDDVLTTGATLATSAQALRDGCTGDGAVLAWTVARSAPT